ncbi:hypothetical protein O3S73_008780 [Bacillus altitudinis]|uniref:hypothetical protein n=1 Tax=Bacillus altitudinis TaxID=293387 RepID=UPI0022AF8C73|nr:hypothetical protein [Bacillus altitudinis]MDR7669061.1 hypothetical protein [Bacillus altitudinis]
MNENNPIISIEELNHQFAKEQAFQARYDFHISKKYEAMAGFYDGWSSSADARNHHALSASLIYQDALTAGFKLKTEGE